MSFFSFSQLLHLKSDARKQHSFITHFSLEIMVKWFSGVFSED